MHAFRLTLGRTGGEGVRAKMAFYLTLPLTEPPGQTFSLVQAIL